MDYLQYKYIMKRVIHNILVLNLVINGLPSIQIAKIENAPSEEVLVLNLVINGLPSIL